MAVARVAGGRRREAERRDIDQENKSERGKWGWKMATSIHNGGEGVGGEGAAGCRLTCTPRAPPPGPPPLPFPPSPSRPPHRRPACRLEVLTALPWILAGALHVGVCRKGSEEFATRGGAGQWAGGGWTRPPRLWCRDWRGPRVSGGGRAGRRRAASRWCAAAARTRDGALSRIMLSVVWSRAESGVISGQV